MPDATTSLQMTRDENYIYATGEIRFVFKMIFDYLLIPF